MAIVKREFIDPNELMRYINENHSYSGLPMAAHICTMELLTYAPRVDAVEVIRCKDCKYYDNSEGIQWCHLNSKFYRGGFDWHNFPEDGFCCFGERRKDD